jgi:hypothetical protein
VGAGLDFALRNKDLGRIGHSRRLLSTNEPHHGNWETIGGFLPVPCKLEFPEQQWQLGRKEGCSGVNGEWAVVVCKRQPPLQMPVRCARVRAVDATAHYSRAAGNQ